jgi:DNA-binding transcriptional MerR regulator
MNYSEVKELLDAGFSVDEIRGMMGSNPQNPQDNPQPEPEQTDQKP